MKKMRFPGLADIKEPLQHTRNIMKTPNAAEAMESIVAKKDADFKSRPLVITSA